MEDKPQKPEKKIKLRGTKPFPAQTEWTPTNSSGFKLVWVFFFYIESDIRYSVDSNVLLASTVFLIPEQVTKVNEKQNKMQHKEKLIMIKA